MDISIIMPCLNEESCVGACVEAAKKVISEHNLEGEVLVVDNASEDNSKAIATEHGAVVITENNRGYGNALRTGIKNSKGNVVVLIDCDTTYSFEDALKMYDLINNQNYEFVIGNRFEGGIEKKAMPFSHKLGVRFLSFMGRCRCHTDVYDFHCGLRAIKGDVARKMNFETTGMEFATEMIFKVKENDLSVKQIPTKLTVSEYKRSSKLHTIRDGFRHLKYILRYKNRR